MSATFKFLPDGGQPQQQLFTDVQALNQLSEPQLSQFVSMGLGFLAAADANVDASIAAFAAEHGAGAKQLSSSMQGLLFFATEALRRSLKEADVAADLRELGMQAPRAAIVASLYSGALGGLAASAAASTFKVNRLVDMEWKFGVTAATSEARELGAVFLQLKLVLDRGAGKKESVMMEMSLSQFYQFLATMQGAAAELSRA